MCVYNRQLKVTGMYIQLLLMIDFVNISRL